MGIKPEKLQKIIAALALTAVVALLAFFISDDITNAGNESSRLATVEAMIDRGTFAVDSCTFRTVDVGKLNGHFYSDKPILFSAWLAGVYAFIKHILMISFQSARLQSIYLINLLGVSSLTVGLYLLFIRRLKREEGCFYLKTALSIALIFTTWIFSYTVSINNHTVAAFLVFGLFLLTEKATTEGGARPGLNSFFAGLAGGLLCAVENPVGGIFSLTALICIFACGSKKRWSMIGMFFLGGLLPAMAMAILDYCGWGNILPVYLIKDAYNFKGNIHSSDFAGLRRPENYLVYFFNIMLGSRGLFSHMPFLLLIFPAMLIPKKCFPKGTLKYFLFGCVATIIFYAFFTGDYGGWAYGFRFLIPIIPILFFAISKWLVCDASKFFVILALPLLAVGLITSSIGAYNPWPVCAEGASTNKKAIDRRIESPLKANLLCMLYEISPERAFKSGLYDHNTVRYYLPKALMNMRRLRKPTKSDSSFITPRRTRPLAVFAENYLLPALYLGLFVSSIFYLAGRCGEKLFVRKHSQVTQVYIFYVMAMTLITMTAVLLTGAAGILRPYCLTAIPLVPALWLMVRHPGPILKMETVKFQKKHWLFIIPLLLIICRLAVLLPLTPNAWDSMTYHLYIPLRWMQAGEIFHVPTVFGDNAAAYAPKNGGLIYAAVMTLIQRDFLLNSISLIYLVFAACALYEICRELKLSLLARCGAVAMFASAPFIMDKAFSSDVDIMALAFLLGGVYFFIRQINSDKIDVGLYGALCLGLAVGAKTAYAPFGGVIAAPLLLLLLFRRRWLGTLEAFGLMFIGGGFWYVYNLLSYGSPVFPAEVAFGGITIFPGAYGSEALQAGEFHFTSIRLLSKQFFRDCSYLTGIVLVVGLLGLLISNITHKKSRTNMLIVAILAALWLLIYYYVIPHNQQMRFLFPVVSLTFIGFVMLLDKLPLKVQAVAYIGALLFYCGENSGRLNKTLLGLPYTPAIWLFIILTVAVVLMLKSKKHYLWVIALLLIAFFSAWSESAALRTRCLIKGDFGTWWKTYVPFNSSRPQPLKIAYTGLNIPYALTGPQLANEVFYCNITGDFNNGFYEFWKKDPKVYSYHKPGICRKKPDPKKWLENLFDSGADYLVVFRMHPAERTYIRSTKDGYPLVEQTLINRLPQFFKLESSTKSGRIYRIIPPPPAL